MDLLAISEQFRQKILTRVSNSVEACEPVKSVYVYGDGSFDGFVVSTFKTQDVFFQIEVIDGNAVMYIVYNPKGEYVGDFESYLLLHGRGITQFEPAVEGSRICTIGFSPKHQRWYGYSHRSSTAFSIGSSVDRLNVAYVPKDKEDTEDHIKRFWEHGHRRETNGVVFTTYIRNIIHDVEREGVLGMQYDHITVCSDPDRGSESLNDFCAYPVPWGKGEWVAETLDDAKQMAIDFARNIS